MSKIKQIEEIINESIEVKKSLVGQIKNIERATKAIYSCFYQGNKLLIFGNGGSAADAQHIAAEFVNKFKIDREPFPAIALTTDSSILSSISNDSSFSYVFEKQIKALGKKGDIALALTTSDISYKENVHSSDLGFALRYAKQKEMKTIGLVSEKSKEILKYLDIAIAVPSKNTPRIQECHMLVYHIICELVEKEMVKNKENIIYL